MRALKSRFVVAAACLRYLGIAGRGH